MPYEGAFQTTVLGRSIRFVSRGKWLKYPDEIEIPECYRPPKSDRGEKRERWRSVDEADRRWRGSSRSRVNQIQPGRTGNGEGGMNRASSDDTVVDDREERREPRTEEAQGGSNEKETDPNLVDWYSETDQENP